MTLSKSSNPTPNVATQEPAAVRPDLPHASRDIVAPKNRQKEKTVGFGLLTHLRCLSPSCTKQSNIQNILPRIRSQAIEPEHDPKGSAYRSVQTKSRTNAPSPRLLFVNRYFYPDTCATSQLLTDLAIFLAKEGHDVHIVTSRQLYENPRANLAAIETHQGVHIHRVATSRFGRQPLAGRLVDYGYFYTAAAHRLFKLTRRGDIIIAKTDPPLISVIGASIAKARSATLINWVQDLFPEAAAAFGIRGLSGPVLHALKYLRNASLHRANTNVVLGESMRQRLQSEGVSHQRIQVIPNWSNNQFVKPVDPTNNELLREWKLEGKFVVGYSGNLGRVHDFRTALDAAENLRNHSDIVFLFVGGGANFALAQCETAKRKLSNVIFKPYQTRERLAETLSIPTVHLISLQPEFEGLIFPSKLYGILAAGRPSIFIGDENGEIAQLLQRNQCGKTAPPRNASILVQHILTFARDLETTRRYGASALEMAKSNSDTVNSLLLWKQIIGTIGDKNW